MNEEAAFIQAILADPDDRTTLLVYADWLQDRDDPRSEYLRLLASDRPDRRQLARLRRTLDAAWVRRLDNRHYRNGVRVRILDGAFANMEGGVTEVAEDSTRVTVQVVIFGRPIDLDIDPAHLERAGG